MSKKDDKSNDRSYEVGYKRPPKQHQFKPKSRDEASESAPRRNRQKHKKTQTKQVDLARLFAEPVAVAKGGRVVNMDPFEIMLRKQIEMAIKHRDHAAAKAVIDEAAKWDLLSTPPPAPGGGVLLVPLNSEEDLKRYQETFFPTDETDSMKWEDSDE